MTTVQQLTDAHNPLPLQALFYTDGVKSHIDLGSNDGRTMRGNDLSILTGVELYEPSVALAREAGLNVITADVRNVMDRRAANETHVDRVTMFDVIEHLPREDGERIIEQIEQVASREILFFVPVETAEMHEPGTDFMAYRTWGLSQHPQGQAELQRHLSFWTQDDFVKRGYLVLTLEKFQDGRWDAFFAAKYTDPADAQAALDRINAYLSEEPELPEARIAEPCHLMDRKHMSLGKGVYIGPYGRIECVPFYAGQRYQPRLIIGDGTTIEWNAHLACAGNLTIGKDCIIAGRVSIMDHEHGYKATIPLHGQPLRVRDITLEDGCFLGENVMVLPGVKIGRRSVVGAGAVVTKSIPAYSIAAGVPARVIGRTLGLTSIVIPTYNGRDLLAACLNSIAVNTPEPHEVIVVDNGSSDDTVEWVERWRVTHPEVSLVKLPENLGYPGGANHGMAHATGDYVCLLNNDTQVTDGWLYEMIVVMDEGERCGLVGPMSDNVSGQQSGPKGRGSIEAQRLAGFCLLIRRAVLDQLGGLDTRFGLGNFDDDDYCLRAIIKGWACRVACQSFVHHLGYQSWSKVSTDLNALLETNKGVFYEKWGLPTEMPTEGVMIDLTAAKYVPLPEV